MWRVDRARSQDDALRGEDRVSFSFTLDHDSCGFFSLQGDSADESFCHEGQVCSTEDGVEKGSRGGFSSAVVDGALGRGESFLGVSVVVSKRCVSCLSRRLNERCIEGVVVLGAGDTEFSSCAAPRTGGGRVWRCCFYFLEVGEDLCAVPSFRAELFPCVEV